MNLLNTYECLQYSSTSTNLNMPPTIEEALQGESQTLKIIVILSTTNIIKKIATLKLIYYI